MQMIKQIVHEFHSLQKKKTLLSSIFGYYFRLSVFVVIVCFAAAVVAVVGVDVVVLVVFVLF